MKCDDRSLSYSWWSEQMTAEVTAGSCMAFDIQPQELMTFDTYPQSKRMNWMTSDIVLAFDTMWWKLDKAFEDSVTATDAFYYTLNGSHHWADTVGTADQIYLYIDKVFGDTVSVIDDFLIGRRESMSDTVTATDHGVLNIQNYFQVGGLPNGYFAADYFGTGYTW